MPSVREEVTDGSLSGGLQRLMRTINRGVLRPTCWAGEFAINFVGNQLQKRRNISATKSCKTLLYDIESCTHRSYLGRVLEGKNRLTHMRNFATCVNEICFSRGRWSIAIITFRKLDRHVEPTTGTDILRSCTTLGPCCRCLTFQILLFIVPAASWNSPVSCCPELLERHPMH